MHLVYNSKNIAIIQCVSFLYGSYSYVTVSTLLNNKSEAIKLSVYVLSVSQLLEYGAVGGVWCCGWSVMQWVCVMHASSNSKHKYY